ncbi:MAG: 2-dehydropantoate 2-reductase N-terminal domain-containing protein, partial [Dissulfurimicrobium sp.]
MKRVAVIGAGSWGTAIAVLLAGKGFDVMLWARNPQLAEIMARFRENPDYLPGIKFPDPLCVASDLSNALLNRDLLVFAVPSHGLRMVAEAVSDVFKEIPIPRLPKAVVSAVKGIENETLLTMTG